MAGRAKKQIDHYSDRIKTQMKYLIPVLIFCGALFIGATLQLQKDDSKARGEARIALFKECLLLTKDLPPDESDDKADIVFECSNQAYYMTRYIP